MIGAYRRVEGEVSPGPAERAAGHSRRGAGAQGRLPLSSVPEPMDQTFFSATILLVLITDPLGNIPFFISALKHVRPERKRFVVVRECLIAFAALLVFLVCLLYTSPSPRD